MQLQRVESGVQLFSRINTCIPFKLQDINPKLFQGGCPRPNDIIEVAGEFIEDLLVDFLTRCVLPTSLDQNWKESGAVFINTNQHISVLKITSSIDAHLKNHKVENRKSLIEKALTFITILNCYDEEQFEMTLRSLDKIIQDRDNVSLLIVDDITTQFWIAKESDPDLSLEQFTKINFGILQSAVKNLNIVLIFSRGEISDSTQSIDLEHVDYKIIGEKLETQNQFLVIDGMKKTSITVPFNLDSFITFI